MREYVGIFVAARERYGRHISALATAHGSHLKTGVSNRDSLFYDHGRISIIISNRSLISGHGELVVTLVPSQCAHLTSPVQSSPVPQPLRFQLSYFISHSPPSLWPLSSLNPGLILLRFELGHGLTKSNRILAFIIAP